MKNAHLKIGLPLIFSAILGSFGLQFMLQSRYDYEDQKKEHLNKKKLLGTDKRESFDIRKAYFDLTKNKDLDDWDFVRVPRPKGEE
jgi:hypothetical protein